MDEYENQSLTTHMKKKKNEKEEHSHKNKRTSKEGSLTTHMFSCDEKGHFPKECPKKEEWKDDMIKKYQSIIHNDFWI